MVPASSLQDPCSWFQVPSSFPVSLVFVLPSGSDPACFWYLPLPHPWFGVRIFACCPVPCCLLFRCPVPCCSRLLSPAVPVSSSLWARHFSSVILYPGVHSRRLLVRYPVGLLSCILVCTVDICWSAILLVHYPVSQCAQLTTVSLSAGPLYCILVSPRLLVLYPGGHGSRLLFPWCPQLLHLVAASD